MNSILQSVKETIGVYHEDDDFDGVLIMQINSVFAVLQQIGVGPVTGFMINGPDQTWDDYTNNLMVKGLIAAYVPLKVKMLFDPPQNSSLIDSMKKQIDEYEARLNYAVDPITTFRRDEDDSV